MKTFIYLIFISLVTISCEKDLRDEPPEYDSHEPGLLDVVFNKNASLKSAFDLVNEFHFEIILVEGIKYISGLPPDSIDYVVDILKTKTFLNKYSWTAEKNENIYKDTLTGVITITSVMIEMDEISQTEWAITFAILQLGEQPSVKSFLLKVPPGKEIYWRNKFRNENIVSRADLVYFFGPNL